MSLQMHKLGSATRGVWPIATTTTRAGLTYELPHLFDSCTMRKNLEGTARYEIDIADQWPTAFRLRAAIIMIYPAGLKQCCCANAHRAGTSIRRGGGDHSEKSLQAMRPRR